MSELVYIVFLSRADEERGFGFMVKQAPLHAFRGGVYGVRRHAPQLLEAENIGYRFASDEEISAHVTGVRLPFPLTSCGSGG